MRFVQGSLLETAHGCLAPAIPDAAFFVQPVPTTRKAHCNKGFRKVSNFAAPLRAGLCAAPAALFCAALAQRFHSPAPHSHRGLGPLQAAIMKMGLPELGACTFPVMPTRLATELHKVAEADFPSRFGHFRIFGFESRNGRSVEEAVVLKMGDLRGDPAPLVRIHSQCLTGDVFHSLRCDCRAQLELSLAMIADEGRGLLIYEHKEGRGIGLLNKLRAYELQDEGADTVEANERLGFAADLRSYELPAQILLYFGIHRVRLLSNNPDKIQALERSGIEIVERVPCQAEYCETAENYLRTKKERMGHLLEGF